MARPFRVYRASARHEPLRQGEVLSDIIQLKLDLATLDGAYSFHVVRHPWVVLMTQDCDLEQDHRVRFPEPKSSDKLSPSLLFCEAIPAVRLFANLGGRRKEWERLNIDKNKNERFHFLQRVDGDCDARQIGVEELGLDFKRYFSLPTEEVYARLARGEAFRRCVLNSPYLEHLGGRFAHYPSRVALPEDHWSAPNVD